MMKNMDLNSKIIREFVEFLEKRFLSNIVITEDSIRYDLFQCLNQNGVNSTSMVLEFPHPSLPHHEVDLVIVSKTNAPEIAIECKYDRKNKGGSNQNRTQRAGKLFQDIYKLKQIKEIHSNCRCFFIYITDDEMTNYLTREQNSFGDFFALKPQQVFEINENYLTFRADSFRDKLGDLFNCKLKCVANVNVLNNSLRIYEVL